MITPQQFSKLTAVADLASVDLSPKPLTLRLQDGFLWAIYPGTYIRGEAGVPYSDDASMFPCTVGSKQFAAIGQVLGSQGVMLVRDNRGNGIVARSTNSALSLRSTGEEPEQLIGGPNRVLFTANLEQLTEEVDLAAGFTTKLSSAALFTGVRVMPSASGVGLMAFDGYSGFFVTSAPATPADARYDVTLPAKDFLAGLQMLDGETVTFGHYQHETSGNSRIALSGDHCAYHCTPLAGQWPDLRQLSAVTERRNVTVRADQVKAAAASSKLLLGDSALVLEGLENGRVVLRTGESEEGRFATMVEGSLDHGYRAAFDAAHLRLASDLGDEIKLEIAVDSAKPTLVQAGTRRYWIARRTV